MGKQMLVQKKTINMCVCAFFRVYTENDHTTVYSQLDAVILKNLWKSYSDQGYFVEICRSAELFQLCYPPAAVLWDETFRKEKCTGIFTFKMFLLVFPWQKWSHITRNKTDWDCYFLVHEEQAHMIADSSPYIMMEKLLSHYTIRKKGEFACNPLPNQQKGSERGGQGDRQEAGRWETGRLYVESRLHKSFTSHAWLCDCKMPKRLWGGEEVSRRWKRSKLEKIKWRGGRRGRRGRAAEREPARWRGAGGRGRQADERFIKGKGKMMWRAYEVGPLSSELMPLATDDGE